MVQQPPAGFEQARGDAPGVVVQLGRCRRARPSRCFAIASNCARRAARDSRGDTDLDAVGDAGGGDALAREAPPRRSDSVMPTTCAPSRVAACSGNAPRRSRRRARARRDAGASLRQTVSSLRSWADSSGSSSRVGSSKIAQEYVIEGVQEEGRRTRWRRRSGGAPHGRRASMLWRRPRGRSSISRRARRGGS